MLSNIPRTKKVIHRKRSLSSGITDSQCSGLAAEEAQHIVGIGLGNCDWRYGIILKVELVPVLFLAEHFHLVHIHYVFPMTAHEAAAFETFLDGLESAPDHILLQGTLAVGIPDYYIVVIGFDIV